MNWLLPGLVSIAVAGVLYTASQLATVPQANKAISDIASSMDHLRSDIQAASASTNQRIEALALQVGRSDIASQGVQAQLQELRSKQDRADLADRDLDVRLAKATVQLEALHNTMEANAARSKEVDDRMIATMRLLGERVDSLTRGGSRNSYDPVPRQAAPMEQPSLIVPDVPYRDASSCLRDYAVLDHAEAAK